MLVRMFTVACLVFLLFGGTCSETVHASHPKYYTNHVIFTAPSAEKIYDGTPLTEQIDVTVQGLPEGFTYKAVAEGSVTYPEDNQENNNIVTDYIIYDQSGLNVTELFVNVELRPGTLRVSYSNAGVLGARRDTKGNVTGFAYTEPVDEDEDKNVEIEDEDTAKAGKLNNSVETLPMSTFSVEVLVYSVLFVILLAVFGVFVTDSRKMRE